MLKKVKAVAKKVVSKVASTKGSAARTYHKVRVADLKIQLGHAKASKNASKIKKAEDKLKTYVAKGPSYIPARKKK